MKSVCVNWCVCEVVCEGRDDGVGFYFGEKGKIAFLKEIKQYLYVSLELIEFAGLDDGFLG